VEISNAFEAKILTAEASVLVHPKVRHLSPSPSHKQVDIVRGLHVISAQIIRFKRQILSLLHVALVIRDEDVRRTQAVLSAREVFDRPEIAAVSSAPFMGLRSDAPEEQYLPPGPSESASRTMPMSSSVGPPTNGDMVGYFTPLSKVYMSDVIDHLEVCRYGPPLPNT
jgi:hypothetical protein